MLVSRLYEKDSWTWRFHITQLCSTIQKKSFETQIGNLFWPMYLKSIWSGVASIDHIMFRNLCYWLFLNSILQYSLQIVANNVDVFSKGYKILYNIYWVGFICNNGKLQRIASFAKRRFFAEIFLIFSSFSKKYLSLSFSFVPVSYTGYKPHFGTWAI